MNLPKLLTKNHEILTDLLTTFLSSRRQGISPHTIAFYQTCLKPLVKNYELTSESINQFLSSLNCNTGGKLAYTRAIRAFCNWLTRNDYLKDNPIKKVDSPKPGKAMLPSLTTEQVQYLMEKADNPRDKCIISLLADSGMRLNELANIRRDDIDWENYTITIWGKGNKQRKAPFTERSANLLKTWLPFKISKASQEGEIYVIPGELEFQEVTDENRIVTFGRNKPA